MGTLAEQIAETLGSREGALLRALTLGPTWETVLAVFPPTLFDGRPEPLAPAEWALGRARDLFVARSDLARASAFAEGAWIAASAREGAKGIAALSALASWGMLLDRRDEGEPAVAKLREAWEGLRFQLDAGDLRVGKAAAWYGAARAKRREWAEAERLLTQALTAHQRHGAAGAEVLAAQLGEVRVQLGQLEEAVPALREAWKLAAERHGPESPAALKRARPLGLLLHSLGWNAAAIPFLRDLHAGATTPSDQGAAAEDLASALVEDGQNPEEALRLAESSVRSARQLGEEARLPSRLTLLARMALARGHSTDAEGLHLEALEIETRLYGVTSAQVATRYSHLGHFYAGMGDLERAMGWMEAASSLLLSSENALEKRQNDASKLFAELLLKVSQVQRQRGDRRAAGLLLLRGMDFAIANLGAGHPLTSKLRTAKEDLDAGKR